LKEQAQLDRGDHETWGDPECECTVKYPISCKVLGHDTTTELVCADNDGVAPSIPWAGGTARAPEPSCADGVEKVGGCVYDVDTSITTTDFAAPVLAHTGFDPATGIKKIACRKQIQIDRTPLFCGPHTPPYIHMMLAKVDEVQTDAARHGNRVPHLQCLVNCASFYAKVQECAEEDCDKLFSNVGKNGVRSYVVDATPGAPQFAVFKGMAEGIVTQLYKSSEGAVHTNTAAEFARRQKACMGDKAAQATSAIDAAETIKRTYSEFKDKPFAIDCRAFAKNNVNAALAKGTNVDECMAACDTKYKAAM
jgi:hypothetical protein